MNNILDDISPGKVARIAGIGYLIIFMTGFFSNFFVMESLIVPTDAASTANNIMNNDSLFRAGILSFFIMVISDVLLAWALYLLFIPVNRNLSLFSGWLRLINGAIFGIALYNLFGVLHITGGAEYLNAFNPAQRHALIMSHLETFNNTWLIGLVFFGLHLLVLGFLIFKSGYIPKIIGVLLIIASACYLADSFANFLLANYDDYKNIFLIIVVVPGIAGELSFTLWLLIKGGGMPEIRQDS